MRKIESQFEAIKTVAEDSGDTQEEWLHTCVLQGIKPDIYLCYGTSESIREGSCLWED